MEVDRNELKALIREVLKESVEETINSLPPIRIIRDRPIRIIDGDFQDSAPDGCDIAMTSRAKGKH